MQITFKPNHDRPHKKVKENPDKLFGSPAKEHYNEESIVEEPPKQKAGFVFEETAQEDQIVPEHAGYWDNNGPQCPGHKPGWEYPDSPDCKPGYPGYPEPPEEPEEEPEYDYPDYPDYPECPEEEPEYDYPDYPDYPECPEYPEGPEEEPEYDYPEYPECPEEEPDYDCPDCPGPDPDCPGQPGNGHRCEPYPYPCRYYPYQCLSYPYIPWQMYGRTYSQSEALRRGTLFPELNSPYYTDRTPPIIPDPYRDYNQRPPMMRKKRR